ncbi:MAG: hypothetical protein JO089_05295 [Alphaproteobacteria bacterium]|nr:hypothetical protein [Alphaproteobacteria bacterium]
MSETPAAAPRRSLREKSAARLAAVQLLYKIALTGEALRPEKLLAEYRAFVTDDPPAVKPNGAHLKKLLEGIAAHGEALAPLVDTSLTAQWRKERVSPLLLSLLTLGLFELAHLRSLSTAVIINEYATLTGRFFGEKETGFINAALNAAAKKLRDE